LKLGVEISTDKGKYLTKPCSVKLVSGEISFPKRNKKIRDERHGPTSWVSITLTEGKFRQVRKMTAVVGFPTLRLVRVRIGKIVLENRHPGDVIPVALFDV